MRIPAVLAALLAIGPPVFAQTAVHPSPPPRVHAARLTGPVAIDGVLDEPVWHSPDPATGFIQTEPNEARPATQRTEVRFAFDDAALYIGARMFDSQGAAGVQTRLVRRDAEIDTDYLDIIFDTEHDHLGRTEFIINPSGVRTDGYGPGGSGVDYSWDPVWEARTRIDSLGWTAELRIPLSQLRYSPRDDHTWGLQIWRQVNRLNELSSWAFWPRNESGGPQRFGHLAGLQVTASAARAELLPYVVGRSSNLPAGDPADPFNDPHYMDGRAGIDAKVLVSSNLTLSATVNPDFGQVEVDPAVVNLSAFETFFDERRPFFVEGSGLFSFGGLSCFFCSNVSSLSLFYSRRIGRSPQAAGNAFAEGPYADIPDNTTILGAAKLTGRTPTGWSIGVLDALTGRGRATVEREDGTRSSITVEPLTNYFVGRVARDLRGGSTVIRGMATSVVRDLDDPLLARDLSRHSEAAGISTDWWFGRRDYRLMAQFAFSQVSGEATAIDRLQRSSARYFQRPDREHGSNGLFTDRYDPTLTSLRGFASYIRFGKSSGNWLWEAQTNIRSPGFENNDIAFLTRSDYAWMSANVLRNFLTPTRWYRTLSFLGGAQQQYNFDGNRTDWQTHVWSEIELPNYWDMEAFYIRRGPALDDRLTRGGPLVKHAGFHFGEMSVSTDSRKTFVVDVSGSYGRTDDDASFWTAALDIEWRPLSNASISIGPSYDYSESTSQFLRAFDDPTSTAWFGRRYVFAGVNQRELSMNTRLNVTFTPNLSLELFAQPFVSSGDYADFKEFTEPRALTRAVYGRDIGTISSAPGSDGRATFTVDPDAGGPAAPFSFDDPSFTVRSLRGNAVLRWEYRPGSTIFLVWTQSREDEIAEGRLDFSRDVRRLFSAPAENIFLVKVNYWIGL